MVRDYFAIFVLTNKGTGAHKRLPST